MAHRSPSANPVVCCRFSTWASKSSKSGPIMSTQRQNRDSIWVMHAGGDGMDLPTRVQSDSDWVSHIGTTCTNLTALKLEFTMEVSSAGLAAFFGAMPQLQMIRLGREMDSVLDRDAVTAILTVPCLRDLSMEYGLNSSFMNEFVCATMPARILPSIDAQSQLRRWKRYCICPSAPRDPEGRVVESKPWISYRRPT
jgi:hypothetical protein